MHTNNNTSTLELITKCTIFEFMRYFFCDPQKYAMMTTKCKKEHLFMFYRLMSIKYPVQMNAISNFHDTRIVDVLHSNFGSYGAPYPKWLYQKQEKSEVLEKSLLETVPKELIDRIYEVYEIEYKSLLLLYSIDKDALMKMVEAVKPDDNKIARKKVNRPKKK